VASMPMSRKEKREARKVRKKTRADHAQSSTQKTPGQLSQIEHRLKHEAYTVGGQERGGLTLTKIDDPLRVDKLLTNGIIDEAQHNSGLQLIALWMIANRPLCGSMNFGEERVGFKHNDSQVQRMTAEDQFFRTMMYLTNPALDYLVELHGSVKKQLLSRKEKAIVFRQIEMIESMQKRARMRTHDLICSICFEELGVIQAARKLGIPVNDSVGAVRQAFDYLGEALKKMRLYKKELTKKNQQKSEPLFS